MARASGPIWRRNAPLLAALFVWWALAGLSRFSPRDAAGSGRVMARAAAGEAGGGGGGEDSEIAGGAVPEPVMVNVAWTWTKSEKARIDRAAKTLKPDADGFFLIRRDQGDFKRRPLEVRSSVSARFTASVDEYFRLFLKRFPDVFPNDCEFRNVYTIRLFVYRDQAEYRKGVPAHFAKQQSVIRPPPEWSAGIHVANFGARGGSELAIFTFADIPAGTEGEPDFDKHFNRGVLQHEGTHAMLSALAGRRNIPVFFNEGCATYFEVWDLRVGAPTKAEIAERVRRGHHLRAVADRLRKDPKFAPNLDASLMTTREEWDVGDVALRYGLAEAFADFMLNHPGRRKLFREIVNTALQKSDMTGKRGVTRLIEKKTADKLEPLWHAHLRELADIVENTIVVK